MKFDLEKTSWELKGMGLCRAARISIRTICDREGRLGGGTGSGKQIGLPAGNFTKVDQKLTIPTFAQIDRLHSSVACPH